MARSSMDILTLHAHEVPIAMRSSQETRDKVRRVGSSHGLGLRPQLAVAHKSAMAGFIRAPEHSPARARQGRESVLRGRKLLRLRI